MGANLSQVSILTRREIEARIAGPLIQAFMEEFGVDKTLAVVKPVIEKLAKESGAYAAEMAGGNSVADFAKAMSAWAAGGAYEQVVLKQTETQFDFDVKRCRYAEMYKELGLADLGFLLSCARDFAMIEGFNPKMKLTRTKTIMEGSDCCDFRITLE
jgi:fumarate reductase iron-sulfur subunit